MTKAWWKSKTLWFNITGGVIILAEYLQTIELGEGAFQFIGAILVIGNYILRVMTSEAVGMRDSIDRERGSGTYR